MYRHGMSKTNNSNKTESSQKSFEKTEPIRWKGKLYCMGCGAYLCDNELLDELEYNPFKSCMCLRCYDKTVELKAAERVDELIKSIANWEDDRECLNNMRKTWDELSS